LNIGQNKTALLDFINQPSGNTVQKGDSEQDDEIDWSKSYADDEFMEMAYQQSLEDAQELYMDMLGEGHFKTFGGFKFGKLGLHPSGEQIHGWINKRGVMALNRLADGRISREAAYHEIIHFIDAFLIDENERVLIYNEIKEKTGLENKKAMEYLATMGSAWMERRKRLPKWSKRIFHALDFITYHMRRLTKLNFIQNHMTDMYYQAYYQKRFNNARMIRSESAQFDTLYS
ncbi:unnamed protein product, partial [marine sediment metagenome]